jgi:hypothetical protein
MKQIENLCRAVEVALHFEMRTPKDFDRLREHIYDRLHEMLSATTLKRLWGYLPNEVEPSVRTLDVVSRFIGYDNYDDFCQHAVTESDDVSHPVMNRHIDVRNDLIKGDNLTIYWLPDRVCHICYEGDLQFVVTDSENTRLKQGDTFSCGLIIECEPLYLSNLRQHDQKPVNYVCGKQGGIRFEIKKNK